jgi:prepilin-type processing-associated H-X9-DG protein
MAQINNLENGATVRGKLNRALEISVSAKEFGVTGDGATDDTAAIQAALQAGGRIVFPPGNYRIAGAGSNAGGVDAVITKDLHVICEAGARFFTDDGSGGRLDNDLVLIRVPSNGAGLPADGVTVLWQGGLFDQREQKQSTSVPFRTEHPAPTGFDGASATCDALSIRGDYTITGTDYHGIRQAVIEGITCIAGTHWETAGGDSGVFISGCENQIVRDSVFVGNRDLGVYASGSANSQLRCKTVIESCLFKSCFFGASAKRSGDSVVIRGCDADNCVRGYAIEAVGAEILERAVIEGNSGSRLNQGVKMMRARGYTVRDNHFTAMGAYRADGSTIVAEVIPYAVYIEGSSFGFIAHNSCRGIGAGLAAAFPSDYSLVRLVAHTSGDTVNSDNNVILQNVGDALRTAGSIVGTNNSMIENVVFNAVTSSAFVSLGTQGHQMVMDPATGLHSFSTNVGFADGSTSNPGIFRRSGTNNGIRFGTNLVGIVAGGADRIVANNTGVGFHNSTPIAKPTVSGSRGGNAALASLLTTLANYGLITDSTGA